VTTAYLGLGSNLGRRERNLSTPLSTLISTSPCLVPAHADGKPAIAQDCTGAAPCAFEGFAGKDFSKFLGETQGRLVTRQGRAVNG